MSDSSLTSSSPVSPASLLQQLSQAGVTLFVEDGGLRFRAPQGAFTPALRELVTARKAELLQHLLAQPSTVIPTLRRDQALRMSFGQERIWFLYRLEGPGSTYNITPVFGLHGPLRLDVLQQTFDQLQARHETLRMRFAEQDGVGLQLIEAPAAVPITKISLTHLPDDARQAEAERIIMAQTAQAFDLDTGPVLRVTLLELAPDQHILLPFIHHIIADGWSLGVLHREFGYFYDSLATGQTPALPPLPIQYPDFAAWQRERGSGDRGQRGLDFWKATLADAPQTLALPTDFVRPARMSFAGRVLRRTIAPDLVAALNQLGQRQGCSLYMVLLAAFGVLLWRHSGQDDMLIGSPVANRPTPETEGLIGCFVNTVVLRLRLAGHADFISLLTAVRKTALDAFAYQDVPIEAVIDAVITRRDPSRLPLFQAQFSLQNVPVAARPLASLRVENIKMDRVAAKNDLSFILENRADGLDAELEYGSDLFRAETVSALGDDYVAILQAIVRQADAPLAHLPLALTHLPQARARQALLASTGVRHAPNLINAFAASVARQPDALAVQDAQQRVSYRQLAQRASAVAANLQALQLAPQSVVALLLPTGVDVIAAMLGVLQAGYAYLPLSPEHPAERLAYCLQQASVAAVLVDAAGRASLQGVAPDTLRIDIAQALAHPPNAVNADIAPQHLAYVIFTSGSTGKPKGVMIEHRAVLNLVDALQQVVYGELGQNLNVALMASPVFDASVQQIFPALLGGHTLHLIPPDLRRDASALVQRLGDLHIDISDATPSLLQVMLHGGLAERTTTLRHLLVGGEALPRDLVLQLYAGGAGGQITVSNVYGPTECCVDATILRVVAPIPGAATLPIGRALPGYTLWVVDEHDQPLPVGGIGEILIGGAGLARGYIGDAAQTAQRFPTLHQLGGRVYRTGDIGRLLADGVLEFLGRNDDQVKVLGYRIELGDIESALRQHPAIRAVSVQARQAGDGQRELVAYIVLHGETNSVELRQDLATRLPAYMLPSYFVVLDALPLNASGKVDRQALPDPSASAQLASGNAHIAASSAAERALADIWQRTLKLATVSTTDNYFASGGDSIKALQLVSRLRDAGWQLALADLFEYPSIAQLAPRIAPIVANTTRDIPPFVGIAPLAAIQRFFFATYGPHPVFNQTVLLRLQRSISSTILRSAVQHLLNRHDMLRARFVLSANGWQQEILPQAAVAPRCDYLDLRQDKDWQNTMQQHAAIAQTGFQLDQAPLLAAMLIDTPAGQRLLLVAHHLIIDGVSWRIVLEDLEHAIDAAATGTPPKLSRRTSSYADWLSAQDLAAQMAPAWLASYSQRQISDTHAQRRSLQTTLNAAQTHALLTDAHRAYHTEINDLLLTALARAWCQWSGQADCPLTLEGHGREPLTDDQGIALDLSNTVGWFTAIFPLSLTLAPNGDIGADIKRTKETLRRIPHKGSHYLPQAFPPGTTHAAMTLPPLAFNYLGQFDDSTQGKWLARADEALPPSAGADLALPWPLEINAVVTGDTMHITLAYSEQQYTATQAQALIDALMAELHAVIDHTTSRESTELTASELDYDGFGDDGLDAFLASL